MRDNRTTVLFIDDDKDVIESLKRATYSMRKKWKIFYASGGKEGIDLLRKERIDVVVSDLRMPGIDGTKTLEFARDNNPETIRLSLSGYSNETAILKTTSLAHQFISKPANPKIIIDKILSSCEARSYLCNPDLNRFVSGIGSLPTLPEMFVKLEKEIAKPNFSIKKIADLILTDPGISAKILQVVNSGFFGLPIRITKIDSAISYLGINIVKALVLHATTYNAENADSSTARKEIEKIGAHSLGAAKAAEKICKAIGLKGEIADDSFLSGILHDIGKLILLKKYISDSVRIPEEVSGKIEIETHSFGFNHAEAGAFLLGIWGLPDEVVKATAYHHDPNESQDFGKSPLLAVYLSNILTQADRGAVEGFLKILGTNDDKKIKEFLARRLDFDFAYLDKVITATECINAVEKTFNLR